MVQENIHVLTEYEEKEQWEGELRHLWRTCFHDPIHYENFYFDTVYPKNKVYVLEDKGMIHLNYYRCKVMGHELSLPYIVGVATNEKYRRQGVMRNLLEAVLADLYQQKLPFTYLMPANEEYYTPFGFRSVSPKSELELLMKDIDYTNHFQYLSYEEIKKLSPKVQSQLREEVNKWLEQRYDVYAVHDEVYYDLLYAEKTCQGGDVVFCFDGIVDVNHLYGMFAYAMDGNTPYVEQVILKEQISQGVAMLTEMFGLFFTEYDRVRIVQSYPYMLRIIDKESFVTLFQDKLSAICTLPIADIMTSKEMMQYLFEEKGNIYFAEIV